MNFVKSFTNQQIGTSPLRDYDAVLGRLACKKKEEFRYLFPEYSQDNTVDTPIFACKFAQVQGYEHILALANEDGRIALCDTDKGGPRYGGDAHNNAIFDLAWMPKRMKLVSASGDHTAALYDFQNGDIELEQVFQGHTRSLKTISCRVDDFCVFATGARDGQIIIWDSRVAKSCALYCGPDVSLPYTHYHPSQVRKVKSKNGKIHPVISGSSSVTGLVFQDYYTLLSCGAGDGLIKVWDLRKHYYTSDRAAVPKHAIPYSGNTVRNGFSNLLLNSSATKLYANCLDNIIYCYNAVTYHPEPIMKYYGHRNSTFYIKASLSIDDKYLLSGSSDNNAYIWNVAKSEPIVTLDGHEAEVTCVAWCRKKNDTVLVTCSDDLRHKIWRLGPEVIPTDTVDEYSSWAKMEIDNSRQGTHKRGLVIDENSCPYDTSRKNGLKFRPHSVRRCSHPGCTKTYKDELLMIYRNEDMRDKRKKLKTNPSRKRKLLQTVDLNSPNESNELKKFKYNFDFDILTTEDEDSDSPTSNLPNFVIDGVAPHLNTSPVKKVETDWLTKLRMERLPTSSIQELSKPTTSKVPKTEAKGTPSKSTSAKTPSRRKAGNKSQDGSSSSGGGGGSSSASTSSQAQSPILKYLSTVKNNSGQRHGNKSPALTIILTPPKTKQTPQKK